ncbi:MAG: 1-acyl-sn-glycerol-3-phosphate acyltransferase [Bdellovibrionales bacterium]|nr:1-acyl-sn-glycerol-3-phosphate acyltransferase [Bdellovibrionales bacterium]
MRYLLVLFSYFRAILVLPLALIQFLLICVLSLIFSIFSFPKIFIHTVFKYFWATPLLKILNVNIIITGEENLPKKSQSTLYLFNHSSLLDIPLVLLVVPHIYFGAKSSLFKIPIFGLAMKLYGALKIYRGRSSQTIDMYKKEASKRAQNGDSFALAPEGGRHYEHGKLADFKKGPFLLSFFSQIPVVPIVITGAHQVLNKSSIFCNWGRWKSNIKISILPSQPVTQYLEEDLGIFKNKVKTLMQEEYARCIHVDTKSI